MTVDAARYKARCDLRVIGRQSHSLEARGVELSGLLHGRERACVGRRFDDELENAAGCQASRVIVDVHRDGATIRQARSYRRVIDCHKDKTPTCMRR